MSLNKLATARDDLRAAARLGFYQKPSWCNTGAWALATSDLPELRDGAVAIVLARRACEGTGWKDWRYIDTLAAAYAEAGDFAKAVKWQQYAIEQSGTEANTRVNNRLQERLWLYRNNQPYREAVEPNTGNVWRVGLGVVAWIFVIVGVVATLRFFRRKLNPTAA